MSIDSTSLEQFRERIKNLAEAAPTEQRPAGDRLENAKQVFLSKLDRGMAVDLEGCLHCGMCAEVCPFYEGTGDAKYTPIHKLTPLRRFYHRELSPLRWIYRLFTRDITIEDLEASQELVYDSCTECGRCDMVCPVGIHISGMVGVMRQGLAAAGLAPPELAALDKEQSENNTLFGVGSEQLRSTIEELSQTGLEIPLDKERADVMVLSTVIDIMMFRDSVSATAKIMNKLGVDWTFRSCGYEAANFGMLSGHEAGQRTATQRIIDAAIACGAKTVIVPECGHAYPALRWEGANEYGKPLPFDVLAISELIGQEVRTGRLRLKPIGKDKKVTFHDPCKLGRHGGVFEEPRVALEALGVDFRETESQRRSNYCCGGGAGVFLIERAATLRQRAFELKMREVDDTGADSVVTTCGTCRVNFMVGAANANWNKPVESLVELVAENLED